jgi:hypothetical protein
MQLSTLLHAQLHIVQQSQNVALWDLDTNYSQTNLAYIGMVQQSVKTIHHMLVAGSDIQRNFDTVSIGRQTAKLSNQVQSTLTIQITSIIFKKFESKETRRAVLQQVCYIFQRLAKFFAKNDLGIWLLFDRICAIWLCNTQLIQSITNAIKDVAILCGQCNALGQVTVNASPRYTICFNKIEEAMHFAFWISAESTIYFCYGCTFSGIMSQEREYDQCNAVGQRAERVFVGERFCIGALVR